MNSKKTSEKNAISDYKQGIRDFILVFCRFYGMLVIISKKQRTLNFKEGCKMTRQIVLLSVAAVCLILNSPVLATDRLVPSQYPTIQAGIDAAQPGDTIIVAEDTYTGAGNKDLDFGGKAITVRSIVPDAPSIVAATVIDCQNSERGFYFHSGEGPSSVVSGLTIRGAGAQPAVGFIAAVLPRQLRIV